MGQMEKYLFIIESMVTIRFFVAIWIRVRFIVGKNYMRKYTEKRSASELSDYFQSKNILKQRNVVITDFRTNEWYVVRFHTKRALMQDMLKQITYTGLPMQINSKRWTHILKAKEPNSFYYNWIRKLTVVYQRNMRTFKENGYTQGA